MTEPLPGGDQTVLRQPKAGDRVVDRQAMFEMKDEELPPPGVNWYEHNSKPMPKYMGVRVNVDINAMAKFIEPFVLKGDIGAIIEAWQKAKIQVSMGKDAPLVLVKIVP